MRQVPRYLLMGDGRIAHHFQHYFNLLHLSFQTWNRHQPLELLKNSLHDSTHVLLLISDNAIDTMAKLCLNTTKNSLLVHCSGSIVSEYAYGAHPLMTFNSSLYSFVHYQEMPFIIDHDAPDFSDLLPGLSNDYARLNTALKAKYHALCVLSGNFSCLLWQKFFDEMEDSFHLPATLLHPYLQRQMENLCRDHRSALSGPLVRNDRQTIQRNIQALHDDPSQAVYQSFVDYYKEMHHEYS